MDSDDRHPQDPEDPRETRPRLMFALARLAAERGVQGVTAEAVAARAGLSADQFRAEFDSVEDCLFSLYDRTVDSLASAIETSVEPCTSGGGAGAWVGQLDAGFSAVLEYFGALPAVASTCVVEALSLGAPALARRDAALDRFVGYVDMLRRTQGADVPPLAGEMLVRGAYELIYARVARGETESLPGLLDDLRPLWRGPFGPQVPGDGYSGADT